MKILRISMFREIMLMAVFTLSSYALASGDEGLYDDVAPPGSTFVRIVNADKKSMSAVATIGTSKISELELCHASTYFFFPAGNTTVSVGKAKEHFNLEENQFYTVVYKKGATSLIEDTYFSNRRKALISTYNLLLANDIDLTAKSGAVKVIEGVSVGTKKDREINAVKIPLEIFSSGKQIVESSVQALTRGDVYSAFVCGDETNAVVRWQKWDVQPLPTSG